MGPTACRRGVVSVALAMGTVLMAGCGSDDGQGAAASGVRVEAAFYPLQWLSEEVGGDLVTVSNLTRAGSEPHDLELTPRDVAELAEADVVVYLSGFQPAVDDAVADSGAPAFDAADAADLDVVLDDDAVDNEAVDDEQGHDEDDAEVGATDPHFWLDPTKLAAVAPSLAEVLADADPDHAAAYRANAADVVNRLEALDDDLEAGLAGCASTELVTSHEAFGYLAQRYGLEQVGIAGLSPAEEPSGADLAEVTEFVEDHRVRTIYFETLVSPEVAETLASEAGAETAVLDPLEGLTDASQGDDYLEVMRSNLENLRAGQPCR